MITGASQSLFGGLDLHASNVYCGLIDEDGQRVFGKRLPTELNTIGRALEPYRERIESLAVESTYNWYWLVDGLQDMGYATQLANPARMDQYNGLKETDDKTDAFWLAEMVRLGILPTGYIYPKEIRPVRDMLRRRLLLVRQRTQLVLSLQSMLTRQCALRVRIVPLMKWTNVEVEKAFDDPYSREVAQAMLEVAHKQDQTVKALEKSVLKRVRLIEPFDLLLTLPGVGKILGMTIMLETGPIERFASAGDYASYCRAVRSRCLSDGKKKGENNRKNGNKYLGWAWVEAANFAQRFHERPRRWFQRKMARTKRVVATKALACKLSKAGFFVLRDRVPYNEKRMFG
jgi:transposase